jgi:ankyrin repeat protein
MGTYDTFLNAIWNGKIDIVKSEVKKGADVNCVDYDTEGHPTPLILAVKGGREKIAKYLVEKGADVNGKDGNGNTCLFHIGMCKNSADMTRFLIEKGIHVNIRNGFGFTALKFCGADTAAVLKRAGAHE